MKKFLTLFILLMFGFNTNVFANDIKQAVNTAISNSSISKGAISVSIKNVNTGKTVYELNPKMPTPPASIQKIVTSTPAFILLGDDYKFQTKLYKNNKDEYLLVLGADPYLRTKDLTKIVKALPKEIKLLAIDDSIIDDKEWGEGWQWDDDLNPLMPKFSAYNIDKNLMEVAIIPTVKGCSADIRTTVNYPTTFVNHIITDTKTDYKMTRQNYVSPDIITIEGTVEQKKSIIKQIPINSPKKYFKLRLSDAIIDANLSCSGVYPRKRLTSDYRLITYLSHDGINAQSDILKRSNNLMAETVFKIAGKKYMGKNGTGSFEDGLKMLSDFCKKQNIDTSNINIVDASGVSKNNIMTADFMTEFLLKNCDYIEHRLTTAGEGTLSDRMFYLKDKLYAKTGTLSNISSITGYITTKKNNKYVFCIMINTAKLKEADKKMLEEYILRGIYIAG